MKLTPLLLGFAAALFIHPSASSALDVTYIAEWVLFNNTKDGDPQDDFSHPYGIAINAAGDTVYVSDTTHHRILLFEPDGTFIDRWGSFCDIYDPDHEKDDNEKCDLPFSDGAGEFWDPVGLIHDNGYVYVAEYSNDRVQKLRPDGTASTLWGQRCTKTPSSLDCDNFPLQNGWFRNADDVAVNNALGRVYVADRRNHRIQVFDLVGNHLENWGKGNADSALAGTGPGEFNFPVGVAVDPNNGNVYVAEQFNHRIQKFNSAGNPLDMWGKDGGVNGAPGNGDVEFNEPLHLRVDSHSRVFVPDSDNCRIQVLDDQGNLLTKWGSSGSGPGQFDSPAAVAIGPSASASDSVCVFVADTENRRIQKFILNADALADCIECNTPPPSGTAYFALGEPTPALGDTIEVPLLLSTADSVTSGKMTIEYDDACLQFEGVNHGADKSNPGTSADADALDLPGAMAPLTRHLSIAITDTLTNACSLEVFRVRFTRIGGLNDPCPIRWDRSVPLGNPPNHVNTTAPKQVKGTDISFCDIDSLVLKTRATFKVGTTGPGVADTLIVAPLLVCTEESVAFTNMTVEYDSACVTFRQAFLGSSTPTPGLDWTAFSLEQPSTTSAKKNRKVSINVPLQYSNEIDYEILKLEFLVVNADSLPCPLTFSLDTLGNPDNHLLLNPSGLVVLPDLTFIDGFLNNTCNNVTLSGSVLYSENGNTILQQQPDIGSEAVEILDLITPANSMMAVGGAYGIDAGPGPVNVGLSATRPKAGCYDAEGGVLSGQDLIQLLDWTITPPDSNSASFIAGDIVMDNMIDGSDVIAFKQWFLQASVCDSLLTCAGMNCAGTWRFLFRTGPNPTDVVCDTLQLANVCSPINVDVEGVLVGDADLSWPNVFPAKAMRKPARIPLQLRLSDREADIVTLALSMEGNSAGGLDHLIYSLNYNTDDYEYLGLSLEKSSSKWDWMENDQEPGVIHGITHRLAGMKGISVDGDVVSFRFRAISANPKSTIGFSRLKANDYDVDVGDMAPHDGSTVISTLPKHYSISSSPNPFNPMTRILFAIPDYAGLVPVQLRIYDIAGRQVRHLVNKPMRPGLHDVIWDGTRDQGSQVAAGIYFVRINAGDWNKVMKVALVK